MAAEEEREIWSGRPSWRGRMAIVIPGLLITLVVLIVCLWAGLSATITLALIRGPPGVPNRRSSRP